TTYTPAAGAEPTAAKVKDTLGLVTTTTYDPLRAIALTTSDPASYVTTKQYDALGRLTAVYKPGRTVGTYPNAKFGYAVSNTAPTVVTSYTLNEDNTLGTFRTSQTFYDSMLRAREVQTQT